MRPLFSVVLTPSAPMNDDRLSTAGSLRMICASSFCFSVMAANEMDCDACEMPWITPVSCTGKESLGNLDVENDGQHQRGQRHKQGDGLKAQHHLQRAPVKRDQLVDRVF